MSIETDIKELINDIDDMRGKVDISIDVYNELHKKLSGVEERINNKHNSIIYCFNEAEKEAENLTKSAGNAAKIIKSVANYRENIAKIRRENNAYSLRLLNTLAGKMVGALVIAVILTGFYGAWVIKTQNKEIKTMQYIQANMYRALQNARLLK